MLHKSVKWSVILAVVGGLSSCMIYDQRDERAPSPMTYEQQQQKSVKHKAAKASSTSGSSSSSGPSSNSGSSTSSSSAGKGPMQKVTPGPKRAAAPQIPVIQ